MSKDQEIKEQLSTPTENAEPYRHPADQSWTLQILLDLKGMVSKLDERTNRLNQDIISLQQDLKGLPGKKSFWSGIALIISIILALAGLYFKNQAPSQVTIIEKPESPSTLPSSPKMPKKVSPPSKSSLSN